LEGEGVLQSIFQAYAEHRKRHQKMREFEYLDQTPYLHSSDYLRELYRGADTKEKKQKLFDYIQRFEVNDKEYRGYYSLYERIGKELGHIEDEKEEYIQIPKSLIAEYARQMMDDEDFVKYNMRRQRK
jgi:CRISPR/Cas system-associated protein Cas5 (RAMP superfamily)